MNNVDKFYEKIKEEQQMILATSSDNLVTMRIVSPVYYKEGVLIFTNIYSRKYKQLKNNRNCCVSIGNMFVECTSEFLGGTMSENNKELRDIYMAKFGNDSFDPKSEYGGYSNCEFIYFKPLTLKEY